jgi:hypothetical protein
VIPSATAKNKSLFLQKEKLQTVFYCWKYNQKELITKLSFLRRPNIKLTPLFFLFRLTNINKKYNQLYFFQKKKLQSAKAN